MSWDVIPASQQKPGARVGGVWVVLQAWPVANHYFVGMLGPEGARITAGYGGWEEVPVPRAKGITEWRGERLFQMTVDMLIDGWITHLLRPQLPRSFRTTPTLPLRGAAVGGSGWSRPGYPTGGGGVWIEGHIENLESLATPVIKGDTPRSVRLYGSVPHPEVRWVIENLEWGDHITDIVTGRRMRQQVTIHLLEYNQPAELRTLPRGKAS